MWTGLTAAVFVMAVVSDVVWAKYTLHTGDKHALRAALYAAAIVFCGSVSIIAFIQSRWFVVPSAAGAFLGTFVTVKRHR